MDTTPRYRGAQSPKQRQVRAEIERLKRLLKARGIPNATIRKMRIELKSSDPTTRRMWFKISSTSVDLDQEVIIARAVHEAAQRRQRKHSIPFIDAHNATSIRNILGRVVETRLSADSRSVDALVEFVDDAAFRLYAERFATDCSIGFRPVRWIAPDQIGTLSPQDQAALAGLDLRNVRRIFVELEIYEVSACVTGSNLDAVSIGVAKSAVPSTIRKEVDDIIADALDGRAELVAWWNQMKATDEAALHAQVGEWLAEMNEEERRHRKPSREIAVRNVAHFAEDHARVLLENERQRRNQLRGGTRRP